MNGLSDMLGTVVSDDASRLDGKMFATDRLSSVRGRIARRRAARSAGVSGATMLGVGAVAFGAGQVPWGSLVSGTSPAGSPSVVCATSTPDAGIADAPVTDVYDIVSGELPDGVEGDEVWSIIVGDGSESAPVAQIHHHDGQLDVTYADGTTSQVVPEDDGSFEVPLSNGDTLVVNAAGLDPEVVPSDEDEGVVNAPGGDVEANPGDGDVDVVPSDELQDVAGGSTPEPSATCVPATPEPSESASPSTNASTSAAPSAAPSATASASTSAAPSAAPSATASASPSGVSVPSPTASEELDPQSD